MRDTFGHRNTYIKHSFQRNSLIIGFFICEKNSLALTWSTWISGFIWILVRPLSLHVLPLEGWGFIGGAVHDLARVYGALGLDPLLTFV